MKYLVYKLVVGVLVLLPLLGTAQSARPNSGDAAFSQGIQRNAEGQPGATRYASGLTCVNPELLTALTQCEFPYGNRAPP